MRSKELPVELRDRIVSRHRSGEGYQNNSAAEKIHVIYALKQRMEDDFPVVHFHASQVDYTPVVKINNVLNIRKLELNIVGLANQKLMGSSFY